MTDSKGTVVVPKLGNLDLLNASEVGSTWGLNILIYGVSGSGKTTLCGTAQDTKHGRDVLYVDLEGGTMSIGDRPDIAVFKPTNWNDIRNVYEALSTDPDHTFKTVVIDSLTEAQTIALRAVAGQKDLITQQDWGKTNDRVLGMVRMFRALTHTKGINTIFTALERESKDETTGAIRIGPDLTPGSSRNVVAAMDSGGYLTWAPKTGKRILNLAGDSRFVAKVRQPPTMRVVPNQMENPSLADLIDALRGDKILVGNDK